jgi:hypothetical protein
VLPANHCGTENHQLQSTRRHSSVALQRHFWGSLALTRNGRAAVRWRWRNWSIRHSWHVGAEQNRQDPVAWMRAFDELGCFATCFGFVEGYSGHVYWLTNRNQQNVTGGKVKGMSTCFWTYLIWACALLSAANPKRTSAQTSHYSPAGFVSSIGQRRLPPARTPQSLVLMRERTCQGGYSDLFIMTNQELLLLVVLFLALVRHFGSLFHEANRCQ